LFEFVKNGWNDMEYNGIYSIIPPSLLIFLSPQFGVYAMEWTLQIK
jgi:hypothetical protein